MFHRIVENRSYERYVPIVARILLAIQFGIAAYFKIMGFSGEAAMTAAAGVPLAAVAVGLALILEVAAVFSLLSGWMIRPIAGLTALYVALLAILFYHDWSTQLGFGLFVSHLGLIAALLYVSVFGTRKH